MTDIEIDPQKQDGEQPPDDDAKAELGEVAVSGQAASGDQYVDTPGSDDPRENYELAREAAYAEKPSQDKVAQIKANLEAAGQELDDYITVTLRGLIDQGTEAAEIAQRGEVRRQRAAIERRQRQDSEYKSLATTIAASIIEATEGNPKVTAKHPASLLWVDATGYHRGGDLTARSEKEYEGRDVRAEQVYALREAAYRMVGAEPPPSDKFDYTGEHYPPQGLRDRFLEWWEGSDEQIRYVEATVTTPGNLGFAMRERRQAWLRPGGEAFGPEPGVTKGAEVKSFSLELVPVNQAEERTSKAA
ncbi:MAG TPA: hypothetical protein VFB03_01845 [Candidatus Saccharimonadales bacterium]|nr:hypothetical protein [Candidatus Saccharimonadales bacterium]